VFRWETSTTIPSRAQASTDRAQAALVPALEVREVGLDRLRALEVEDRAERAARDAALQLVGRQHEQELRRDDEVGCCGGLERGTVGVDRR